MREYSMLRRTRIAGTRAPFDLTTLATAAWAADVEPSELTVERAQLTARQVLDVARDPGIAALTPTMPVRLVAPRAVQSAAPGSTAWGLEVVRAGSSPFDGAGVTVAVLDTGIDATHPAFSGVQLVERDFTGTGHGDGHGHGTHCAGTVFGRDVMATRIGIARGVTRALIGKVLAATGDGRSDWIQDALLWAARESAQVITMSIGLDLPAAVDELVAEGLPITAARSVALEHYRANAHAFDALLALLRARAAGSPGAVIVAASGDESHRDPAPSHASYRIAASLLAAANGVIGVGAVAQHATGLVIAPFSNVYPQLCAPGVDVVSAAAGGGLTTMSGTSIAAPHVAGVAALWWQRLGPHGRASVVTAHLLASARCGIFASPPDPADVGAGVITAPQ